MKPNRIFILIVVFKLLYLTGWSQSLTLSPSMRSPNSFNASLVVQGGAVPAVIMDQSQFITYNYPSNLGHGSIYISLSSGNIPPGFEIQIMAEAGNWNRVWEGVSTGYVIISNVPKKLIDNIFTTKSITRRLTLRISVIDISIVHPSITPLAFIYTMSAL